jgi:hypothetical protein
VNARDRTLGLPGRRSDIQGMTSAASSAGWLPGAIASAAVLTPSAPAVRVDGRHSAPETPGIVEIVAAEQVGPGRHAEPQWSRELFDATRDEDPFEWLGFGA